MSDSNLKKKRKFYWGMEHLARFERVLMAVLGIICRRGSVTAKFILHIVPCTRHIINGNSNILFHAHFLRKFAINAFNGFTPVDFCYKYPVENIQRREDNSIYNIAGSKNINDCVRSTIAVVAWKYSVTHVF